MKYALTAFFLSFLLSLTGCDQFGGDSQEQKPKSITTEYLDSLVGQYFKVQTALAEDDLEAAKTAAESVVTVAEEGPADAENNNLKTIANAAGDVASAEDMKVARVHFETLSTGMTGLVRNQGGNENSDVYLAHCPMAFDNKGASWLQRDKEILNPYFGEEMLHCGELEEKLAGETIEE